jgi:rhodanese-related sulfurtransferase
VSFAEFFYNNIFLFIVAIVSGLMLLYPLVMRLIHGTNEIGVNDAVSLMNRRDALVIDVRSPAEYASGHIPNARHIPLPELKDRLKEIEKYRTKPVLVTCQTGTRSTTACNLLRQAGFAEAVKLRDGVNGWQQANMPVQKSKAKG